jgi:hypothetical protein
MHGSELPRVCIIGAGSSGIPAVKALSDRGIPFDCFEKSNQIGGNWCFKNKNGMSAAYRSLHINTSRDLMSYADYPMPDSYPDYPSHTLIKQYFDHYVDHFLLRGRITFETTVTRAERAKNGVWHVTLDSGEIREYDALLVANGHHWDPRWPEPRFPGRFDGIQMHSHSYVDPTEPYDLRGKRIVVVGMGNSAMDIAVELSRADIAERVFLSARRGVWIIPKYLMGRPTDEFAGTFPALPWRVQNAILTFLLRLNVGKPSNYGLPMPKHKLLAAHPTISQDILLRLGSGDISPKPNIQELSGDSVRFTDGTVEKTDVIIYCTGYNVSFPFFDPEFISAPENELPLWRRMMKPAIPNLFFLGLVQPLGAIMPIAELQSKFIGDYLIGQLALPAQDDMAREMDREREAVRRRYVNVPRHTMQVDFHTYIRELKALHRRCAARARAKGNPLPVPPRAGQSAPAAASV